MISRIRPFSLLTVEMKAGRRKLLRLSADVDNYSAMESAIQMHRL